MDKMTRAVIDLGGEWPKDLPEYEILIRKGSSYQVIPSWAVTHFTDEIAGRKSFMIKRDEMFGIYCRKVQRPTTEGFKHYLEQLRLSNIYLEKLGFDMAQLGTETTATAKVHIDGDKITVLDVIDQPKYEYGVEYETNGEKPDLPGDVSVFAFGFNSLQCLDAQDVNWKLATSFRITDSRFKAKKENEMLDFESHKRMVDEAAKNKRKLPDLNDIVECCYNSPDEYYRVHIIAHDNGRAIYRWLDGPKRNKIGEASNNTIHHAFEESSKFRPIQSERDKLIDQALHDAGRIHSVVSRNTVESLIDLGWRPTGEAKDD